MFYEERKGVVGGGAHASGMNSVAAAHSTLNTHPAHQQ